MSYIRVLLCHVDDPAADHMTELAAFDLPATDVSTLQPETALDWSSCVTSDLRTARIVTEHASRCLSCALCSTSS